MLIKKLHHEHTPRAGGSHTTADVLSGTGPTRASDERAQRLYFSQQQHRARATPAATAPNPHSHGFAQRPCSEEPSPLSSSPRKGPSYRSNSLPTPTAQLARPNAAAAPDESSSSTSSSKHAGRRSHTSSTPAEAGPSQKRRRLLANGSWLQLPETIPAERLLQDMSNTAVNSGSRSSHLQDAKGKAKTQDPVAPSDLVHTSAMNTSEKALPHLHGNRRHPTAAAPLHANSAFSAESIKPTSSTMTAAQRILETSLRHQPGQFAKRKLAKMREAAGTAQQNGPPFSAL